MASEESTTYVLTQYQGRGLPPDRSDFEDKVKAEKAFTDAKFYSILWEARPPTLGLGWVKLKEKEAPPPAPAAPPAAAGAKPAVAPAAAKPAPAAAPKPPAAVVTPSPVKENAQPGPEPASGMGPATAPAAPPSAVATPVAENVGPSGK